MTTAVLQDGRICVEVDFVKARRRTVAVVVRDGRAQVRIPRGKTLADGRAYLDKVSAWVLRKAEEQRARMSPEGTFRLWGKDFAVEWRVAPRYGYTVGDETLTVCCPEGRREEALLRVRRAETSKFVADAVREYAARTGTLTPAVKVVNVRGYYGKCFYKRGELRFAAGLSRYPREAGEYVVVHELVHFAVQNHSAAFYAEVAKVMPDFAARRRLLKKY